MRKKSGQPNEFGVFVPGDTTPAAPAPAPAPAPIEEPAAEEPEIEEVATETEEIEDTGWAKKGKRKSK